jgi:DNA-binding transcriptional LysR family regulator
MHVLTDPAVESPSNEALAIGCFASLCRDRLAEPLMTFGAAHPDIAVGVHEMGYAELLPAVASRRLALAIRPGEAERGYVGADLWADRAVIAMQPDHPLTSLTEITAAMLRNEVLLISRDRGREQLHRFLAERLFARHAPATRIVADARRSQLLDRVAAGEGIALLCRSQVDAGLTHLAIRPLADPQAGFRVRAYWRAQAMEPGLRELLHLLTATREA